MIVEFKLNTENEGDLLVLNHLFNTLKIDVKEAPAETPTEEASPKKRRGRPKAKKGDKDKSESEIKDMNFKEMDSYLIHKEKDPTDFEVRWLSKLFKKKHGTEAIREILNKLDAHNFTDLSKDNFKKFCNLLSEKYSELNSDDETTDEEDFEI